MDAELLGPTVARAAEPRDRALGSDEESVEWLVDNADAYREVFRAIDRARQSIWITQLALDPDCRVHGGGIRQRGVVPGDRFLLDALLDAARRGVAVRIILNETLLLDTAGPLSKWLQRTPAVGIRVRGVRRFPQLLHAKMLIVDEREALLLGSPFVNGYWDDSVHEPRDPRRPARELGGRPLHDLSALIVGPAVHSLSSVFAELWNDVSVGAADDAPIECRPARARHRGAISITRTAPRGALRHEPKGLTEILDTVEQALASARKLIYIEHQYLSSRRVIAALVAALAREQALEIVIVLNQNPDVTAYRDWQNARLRETGLLSHPRVGIFALWRATPSSSPTHDWTINQLFVHSKVLIVDDEWLTFGSANLDGVSLHSYGHDFSGWLARRMFRHVRNFDVNAVIQSGSGIENASILGLRTALWCEHLALPESALRARPSAGWLALWRARAAAGLASLEQCVSQHRENAPPLPLVLPLVLPYSQCATPSAQLRDSGVRRVERLDICFDPGWLEVRFSPNWVRNMFS